MSTDKNEVTNSDTEPSKEDLKARVRRLEQTVDAITPDDISRRAFLGAGATVGVAALGGYGVGKAEAGSQSAGQIGTSSDPADFYSEDNYVKAQTGSPGSPSGDDLVFFNDGGTFKQKDSSGTVSQFGGATELANLTIDPSLVYVYAGTGSDLLVTRDPANFADIFAAVNDAFSAIGSDDQATVRLPYTGSAGASVSTTLTIPGAEQIPNIKGWGADGTVINYTATDGTHAIDCQDTENGVEYEWSGFRLNGPGSGAGGGGHGMYWAGSTNHAVEVNHVKVENFPGDGIHASGGFFSGSINHFHVEGNGGDGIYADRMNGGSIYNGITQGNGGAQVHLEDCFAGTVMSCDIDSGAGSPAPAGSIGVLVESVNSRAGAYLAFNYLESNETHVVYRNGGLPVRAAALLFNYINSGDTGLHVEANVNTSFCWGNWFQGIGTQDILLDGTGMVLGPNAHISSTTKLTDNTAGGYDSLSQTSGSYPW